jgi:hypothetical protein
LLHRLRCHRNRDLPAHGSELVSPERLGA